MLREFLRESAKQKGSKAEGAGDAETLRSSKDGHNFSQLGESSRTVLYQFPPTIRIYASHIEKPGNSPLEGEIEAMQTTPLEGEVEGAERQRLIAERQKWYRNLGRVHTDAGNAHACPQ
jgi:hypothetical protein